MTTTILSTVGTAGGRTYSTPQAWADALPSSLVTADTQQIVELYNDSTFTGTFTLSGKTTDATRNIIMRAAAGQGLHNQGVVPLRFDPSKGVALAILNPGYQPGFQVSTANTTIIGLQIAAAGYGTTSAVYLSGGSSASQCLFQGILPGSTYSCYAIRINGAGTLTNCVAIGGSDGYSTNGITADDSAVQIRFCTMYRIVAPTNADYQGYPLAGGYGSPSCVNTIGFGFPTSPYFAGRFLGTDDYNFTDAIGTQGCGTHGGNGLTAANQFVSATTDYTTLDVRLKSTSPLIAAGTPISGVTTDFFGQTRNATHPSAGAFEYQAAAAPAFIPRLPYTRQQAVNRASSY